MKRIPTRACLLALMMTWVAGPATAAADLELWRLDCGTVQVNQLNAFSDTQAYSGKSRTLSASCYLIRHGQDYLLWDTGLPEKLLGAPLSDSDPIAVRLNTPLPEQLARIGVTPGQIGRLGISHYHFDHLGQAALFADATLLIGAGDWDALKAGAPGIDGTPLAHWLKGPGIVQPLSEDLDVFRDGSVTILTLPGHTPGHQGLLVRLPKIGPVLLSGDVAHFQENLDSNGVPPFNTNRADSLAAMDRYRKLAESLGAITVLQHDARDIAKLPAFPASAK